MMKKKVQGSFIVTAALFLLFLLFTVAVMYVDRKPIGPEDSVVGFASINGFMHQTIGVHAIWDKITDLIAAVAILPSVVFAALGLQQLIQRKNLWKVDADLLLLGAFYVLTAAVYVIFEFFIVNYRPVLEDGVLEASYPSSHTVLAVCFLATAMLQFRRRIQNTAVWQAVLIIGGIMLAIAVIGRLLSGVHWFTDIAAGVLLGASLVMLYVSLVQYTDAIKAKKRRRR